MLCTCAKGEVRNAIESIEWAQKATQATGFGDPTVLDVLAAAYAEAGRFKEAVDTAEKACQLAVAQGKSDRAQKIQARLKLYRQGKPYHQE